MSETKKTTEEKMEVTYEINGDMIRLTPAIVQNYVVGNGAKITQAEYKFFVELCRARKLNPFLKEAYCIKYSDKESAQLVVGKDIIIQRAEASPDFDGMESGIIVQNVETKAVEEREGMFYLPDTEKLVGGWAKVYRKSQNHPKYVSVAFHEVAQKKGDGSLNRNWSKQGATMVEKVAKVRACREAFSAELSGMYEEVELVNNNTRENNDDVIVQEDVIVDSDKTVKIEDI